MCSNVIDRRRSARGVRSCRRRGGVLQEGMREEDESHSKSADGSLRKIR